MKKNSQSSTKSLRSRAEEILKSRFPINAMHLSEADSLKLIHELQVSQIELELQHEELLKAKEFEIRNKSEAKYKDLIENISDVIYTIDKEAIITFISPSITKLLGYLPEEVIGKNFLHFVGESREQLQKRFEEIQKSIEIKNEYQILSASGEPHWIRFSSKAIYKEGQAD